MVLLVSPSEPAPNYPIIKKEKMEKEKPKVTDLSCGKGILWFTVYERVTER